MKKIYDVIIIGAGPAGMTASVYASKANLKTLLLEKQFPGGKIINTAKIENWPGFDSVEGYTLATNMYNHSLAFGSEYKQGEVISIKDLGDIKEVNLENEVLKTFSIIIASGTKERKIGIPGEDKFYGNGVSYCAVCDGSLHRDEKMVVIGGGNSALQETLYLTNYAQEINLVHRRNHFTAEPKMVEEVKNNPKINLFLNYTPISINGENFVESITIQHNETKQEKTIETSVVFPFIGSDPESSFIKNLNITDHRGYLITNDKKETSIEGIYGAGDVNVKELRQIVTAVNDGAIAAMSAYDYVTNIKKKIKS